MAKKRSKKATKNGGNGNGRSGDGHRSDVQTVTFRIPTTLKQNVERAAKERDMTTTRFVVEALESKVNDEPPAWWGKAQVAGVSRRPAS